MMMMMKVVGAQAPEGWLVLSQAVSCATMATTNLIGSLWLLSDSAGGDATQQTVRHAVFMPGCS
jgi:hypothetical protein